MSKLNYYDNTLEVEGRLSRLSYFFADYLSNNASVEQNGSNVYAMDEAHDVAYAIANRNEGENVSSYYTNFKAIMEKVDPTYILSSSKGSALKVKIDKLKSEINNNEGKINTNNEEIIKLEKRNGELTKQIASDKDENKDEVTYRQLKSKIIKEIDDNNKKIEKLSDKNKELQEEINEDRAELNDKMNEYKEESKNMGDEEYKKKVTAATTTVTSKYEDYQAALSDRESEERVYKGLVGSYSGLTIQYQQYVTKHVDSQGNKVTRKQIKDKGKEVTKAKKKCEEQRDKIKAARKTEEAKQKAYDSACEALDKIQCEHEEQQTSTDVELSVALEYFRNYNRCQTPDGSGNTDGLASKVFKKSTETNAEMYNPTKAVLPSRGQDLNFVYSSTWKPNFNKYEMTVVTHELNFWKLYNEQLLLKTVFDYCVNENRLGEKIYDHLDLMAQLLLESQHNELKAVVSMINEMSSNPTSFYNKTLNNDEKTYIKSVIESTKYGDYYVNSVNKTFYETDEEGAIYTPHKQIIITQESKETKAEIDARKVKSAAIVDKLSDGLQELLEAFYNEFAKAVDVAETEDNPPITDTEETPVPKEDKKEEKKTVEKYKVITTNTRYENEAEYFQKLQLNDPVAFKNIKDKFKYFQPAYHSMSPEGFNARLTFLQQCMRQGHTLENKAGDGLAATAGNLAFGRMPVCVLRIGDFINTRVIIDNMSIQYGDGNMMWDLNPEGIGVQPMFAKVVLTVTLLGGQSLEGPVSRLQNAVSFDYYANAGVYDNRADRIELEKSNGKDGVDQYSTKYKYIFNPMKDNNGKKQGKQ